jgi:hypothetical protein
MILTDEQLRQILGVNAEFCPQMEYARDIEAAVLAELAKQLAEWKATAEGHKENYDVLNGNLRMQLAASQAREQQYREALEALSDAVGRFVSDEGWRQSDMDNMDAADCLLAKKPGTSALEAMIVKAGEVMRELVCSQVSLHLSERQRQAIRALPGVTMEDLQK